MRAPSGAAGLIVAALFLTACEASTAPSGDLGGEKKATGALAAAPAQLTFRIYANDAGRDPPAQVLMVSNLGRGTLDWSAARHTSWLTLWRTGEPGRIVVGLSRPHMHFDALNGPSALRTTITLTAGGAANSPVQVPVQVLISYLPPDKPGPRGNPDPNGGDRNP